MERRQTPQQDILTEVGFPPACNPTPTEGSGNVSPLREAEALVSLPRAALATEDVSSDSGARQSVQSVRASSQALAVVTNWTAGLQNVTEQTS